jgi:hypothetical protein
MVAPLGLAPALGLASALLAPTLLGLAPPLLGLGLASPYLVVVIDRTRRDGLAPPRLFRPEGPPRGGSCFLMNTTGGASSGLSASRGRATTAVADEAEAAEARPALLQREILLA